MTRDEAIKEIQAWLDGCCGEECDPAREAFNMAISALEQDTVSRTAYLQCARERDTAIEQLKELGYDFGEKIRTDGDTISRQAAIDALDSIGSLDTDADRGYAREVFEALPSAQPEIIACGDCKHWICHDRRCGYWNHGVKPLDWCCHAERRTDERLYDIP